MPETEGLGRTGWAALLVLVVGIVAVLVFGFAAAIYVGLLLTFAALRSEEHTSELQSP